MADIYQSDTQALADGPLRGLTWYRHRLAAMSPREILFRIEEQTKRAITKRYFPAADNIRDTSFTLPFLPNLTAGLDILSGNQTLLDDWRQQAEAVREGRFQRYCVTWPRYRGCPDWHLDPVSRQHWPRDTFCYDLNYRDAAQIGDIKLVWELSRFHYLQPLAGLAYLSDDRELAHLVWSHVDDWISNNPPAKGPHWVSSCELAIRTISLLILCSLIGKYVTDITLRRRLLRTFAQHGYWLSRFPSRYSSANHSRLAEAGALFLLGAAVPNMRQALRWQNSGRQILESEAQQQILPDGGGAEQSIGFGLFNLEILLLCTAAAVHQGTPFSEAFMERLTASGQFVRAMTDCGGQQPQIGDYDDVRIISSSNRPETYGTSILACMGSVLGLPTFAVSRSQPDFRFALLTTPQQRKNTKEEGAPAACGISVYEDSGYTIARSDEDGTEALFIFDHGNVGYLSIAAHGHADALAVLLHLAGRPVLIDAGTYRYRAQPGWRDYFRGTAAHNTLIINDDNSSISAGAFNWQRKARARCLQVLEGNDTWCVEAEHDGYVSRYGYRHARMVEKTGPGLFRVVDTLQGSGGVERVEIGFLVAPDLDVVNAAGGFIICRGTKRLLYIRHEGPLKGWVERGLTQPKRGWHAPDYGTLQATSRLVFAGKMWHGAKAQFTLALNF